ncbi:MAG: LytTR family DNA-binding domain-containing protein [Bacteroidia bacterium]|nr:LytTR family DNA-binding domain-containing protein [Bacteroidia bacterium]
MLKAIVVDDEKPSREVMCNYLREYCGDVQVVTTASSVKSAFKAIKKYNPDLVFLDIELSDGKGFDLLMMFEKIDFKVIFVTAYSEHAIKAFRVNAVDYILKPVKIDELKAAIEKVRSLNDKNTDSERIAALIKSISGSPTLQPTITIHHIKGFEVLKVNEIIMCKADGYCTNFFLTGMRKIVSSKNLKYYEELLAEHNFIRVHYSYLINLNHICGYTKQGEIELSEGNRAPLSDSNKKMFFEILSNR